MNSVFRVFKRNKAKTDHLEQVRREQGARLAHHILAYQHRIATYLNEWQHRVGFRTRNIILLTVMFGFLLVFLIPSIQSLNQFLSNGNQSKPDTPSQRQSVREQPTAIAKPDSLTARSGGGQDSTQAHKIH